MYERTIFEQVVAQSLKYSALFFRTSKKSQSTRINSFSRIGFAYSHVSTSDLFASQVNLLTVR